MKLRIYPKKTVVLGLLSERLTDASKALCDAEAYVESMEQPSSLFMPGQDYKVAMAKETVRNSMATVKQLEDWRLLVEAHDPPEVTVDLEVDL